VAGRPVSIPLALRPLARALPCTEMPRRVVFSLINGLQTRLDTLFWAFLKGLQLPVTSTY
jgi:hypothetical protein